MGARRKASKNVGSGQGTADENQAKAGFQAPRGATRLVPRSCLWGTPNAGPKGLAMRIAAMPSSVPTGTRNAGTVSTIMIGAASRRRSFKGIEGIAAMGDANCLFAVGDESAFPNGNICWPLSKHDDHRLR